MRQTLRALLKSPGYFLTTVATLAVAIGATTAVYTLVDGVLLRPFPYFEADRLLILAESEPQVPEMSVSYPNYEDWRRRNRAFEEIGIYNRASYNLTGSRDPERLQAAQVSASFFAAMRAQPLIGRVIEREDDRVSSERVTVLSERLWRSHFGADPTILQREIRLNDLPVKVIGVMPDSFRMPTRADLWVPTAHLAADSSWQSRGNHPGLFGVGRLKPGETVESGRADLNRVARELSAEYPNTNKDVSVIATTLRDTYAGDIRRPLTVLLGAVLFVLLIACANISNLTLARQAARSRELAVRQALGAELRHLTSATLTETAVLAALGGALGLLLARVGLKSMLTLLTGLLPQVRPYVIDGRVILASLAMTALSALIVAALPLWQLRHGDPGRLMGSGSRTVSGFGSRLRRILVASEVALTVVLLAGAFLFLRSFERVTRVDPGFDTSNLVTFALSLPRAGYVEMDQRTAFYTTLEERLRALPGVESVAASSGLPLGNNGWQTSLFIEGKGDMTVVDDWKAVEFALVSPSYFKTLGIPVRAGEVFSPSLGTEHMSSLDLSGLDADARMQARGSVLVIDAEFAKQMWPNEDAVGKRVRWSNNPRIPPLKVVAVVGRVKADGLREETRRIQAYASLRQGAVGQAFVTLRTKRSLGSLTPEILSAVKTVDPNLPIFDIQTMDSLRGESVASDRLTLWLTGLYAAMALLLALIGIVGVTTYSVSQQTRELGVRMALGASSRDVLRHVLGQGLALVASGVVVGLLLALGLSRVVRGLLFEVSATDPLAFAMSTSLLAVAAAIATYLPARRAARLDPVTALRID